jgi:biotin carboxyl carrier protein
MKYEITIGGTTRYVDIQPAGEGRYRVAWDGKSHEIDLLKPSPEAYQMLIDGESWEAGCVASPEGYLVDVMGFSTEVTVVDPRRKALKQAAGAASGMLATQMPGRVVRLICKVGDVVKKGQPIIVIEAMKMENEMKSPIDGTIGEILVAEGVAVETGTKLIRVDA